MARLQRPLTVQLQVPSDVTFLEVAEAFWSQFGKAAVVCCQSWGAGRFQVTFGSSQWLDQVRERGLILRHERIQVDPLEVQTVWLTIRNAPFELPVETLSAALAPYGRILHHEYEIPPALAPISNGNRRVKLAMRQPVPNFVRVGSFTLLVSYPGVVRLCRRCHQPGHMAVECAAARCSGCRSWGHTLSQCPARTESSLVDSMDHGPAINVQLPLVELVASPAAVPERQTTSPLVVPSSSSSVLLEPPDFPPLPSVLSGPTEVSVQPVSSEVLSVGAGLSSRAGACPLLFSTAVLGSSSPCSSGDAGELFIVTDEEVEQIDWASVSSGDSGDRHEGALSGRGKRPRLSVDGAVGPGDSSDLSSDLVGDFRTDNG